MFKIMFMKTLKISQNCLKNSNNSNSKIVYNTLKKQIVWKIVYKKWV